MRFTTACPAIASKRIVDLLPFPKGGSACPVTLGDAMSRLGTLPFRCPAHWQRDISTAFPRHDAAAEAKVHPQCGSVMPHR